MTAKYVETDDMDIIRKQLEHAEKCGVRWPNGDKPTEWVSNWTKNVGYDIQFGVLAQLYNKCQNHEPVTLSEWCDWLSEVTGQKDKQMNEWKKLDLKNPPDLSNPLNYEIQIVIKKDQYKDWRLSIVDAIVAMFEDNLSFRYRSKPRPRTLEDVAKEKAERARDIFKSVAVILGDNNVSDDLDDYMVNVVRNTFLEGFRAGRSDEYSDVVL